MSAGEDWARKLRDAVERIRTRYDHIGRKTAAPFLAIVYPPDAERAVLREWHTLAATLGPEFSIRTVDVLAVTSGVVQGIGAESVVDALSTPMPGSDAQAELSGMWTSTVAAHAREAAVGRGPGRPVVVLERLAALYPISGPRAVMQALWDAEHGGIEVPVVFLIPGVLREPRVYSFVGKVDEFMYRGDIL